MSASSNDNALSKEIAEFAKQHDSSRLVSAAQLPQWILDIPRPSGLVLAADVPGQRQPELFGDIHALGLVDLEAEGLEQYRSYVAK